MHVSKPLVNLQSFVVRSEVDTRPKQLDDVVPAKFVDRVLDPCRTKERDVGVDPCHVFPLTWEVLNGIVDQILLDPYVMTGPNLEVLPHTLHLRETLRAETLDHDESNVASCLSGDKLDEKFATTLKSTKVKVRQNHVQWLCTAAAKHLLYGEKLFTRRLVHP
jgi:hypothetical protein